MASGGGSGSADAFADERVDATFERASKETFVEAMLHKVADGLASDAPFGHNSANRIRGRVEEIEGEASSAGRKVLDARFALGHDDAQYLAQAVTMLWAGDGGERLRLVPAPMMPEIMRHASAEGIVLAMQNVMKEKKEQNQARGKRGLALAGWLMQVPEIREAVLDFVLEEAADNTVVAGAAQTMREEYAASLTRGADYVSALLNRSPDSTDFVDGLIVSELVLLALHTLTDAQSAPMRLVQKRVLDAANLVRRAATDATIVLNLADELLGAPEVNVLPSAVPAVDNDPANLDHCVAYDQNDMPLESRAHNKPEQRAFFAALCASYDRVTAEHEAVVRGPPNNVAVLSEVQQAALPDSSKRWKLDRVVSPFWNQGETYGPKTLELVKFENDNKVPSSVWKEREYALLLNKERNEKTTAAVDTSMAVALERSLRTLEPADALEPRRTDRLGKEDLFANYAVLRGLCGYCGPHQSTTIPELELGPYHYPLQPMVHHNLGDHTRLHDARLSTDVTNRSLAVQRRLYGNEKLTAQKLRPDFFGEVVDGTKDVARPALWAPVPKAERANDDLMLHDAVALDTCAAATYECIAQSFLKTAEREGRGGAQPQQEKLLRAAAASAKIMQLAPMTAVHAPIEPGNAAFLRFPSDSETVAYVTRPAFRCGGATGLRDNRQDVFMPVDSGLARFVLIDHTKWAPLTITPLPDAAEKTSLLPIYDAQAVARRDEAVPDAAITDWLRAGIQLGWTGGEDLVTSVWAADRDFSLYVGSAADNTPVDMKNMAARVSGVTKYGMAARSVAPADLEPDVLANALAHGLMAVRELEQVEHEDAYIQKLRTKGSAEQQGVFGLKALAGNIEGASRDRRQAVWSDALREVAVSGDRLYRFVTQLTGAIGEAADSAISWEDEDLKQMSKEALQRQKALAERVARFQTRLVENVVSSTLKASKLQLEVRGGAGGSDGELVVLSADVKDNLRQVMAGEGGHGLFEANVELNELLGTSSRPMQIGDIVNKLQAVSQEFHNQIARELTPNTAASYTRVVEPRNSFMMHLKPDTSNAIQRAFDYITAEMRHCDGYHRHIHLWEFVEGKDWTLCTRFAELVGLMLQNTRMRSGSFAAYVGQAQLIANTQNIRTQLQRLRTQVCHYLSTQLNGPMFLHKDGRTYYFGGSVRPTTDADAARVVKRQRVDHEESPFDAKILPPPDTITRTAMRRKVLERLRQMTRARRVAGMPFVPPTVETATKRWQRPEDLSAGGSVNRITALHFANREVMEQLLFADNTLTSRASAEVASAEVASFRLRVLLQLRLETDRPLGYEKAGSINYDSNGLASIMHQKLTTLSNRYITVSGRSTVLTMPATHGNSMRITDFAKTGSADYHFVDGIDVGAILESPFVENDADPDSAIVRTIVSLALNSIFGMPNTPPRANSEYNIGTDNAQWMPYKVVPGRWVRLVDDDEHRQFQRESIAWYEKAIDMAHAHQLPDVPAILLAWCALLLLPRTKHRAELEYMVGTAEALCRTMSFNAPGYVTPLPEWLDASKRPTAPSPEYVRAMADSFDLEQHAAKPANATRKLLATFHDRQVRDNVEAWIKEPKNFTLNSAIVDIYPVVDRDAPDLRYDLSTKVAVKQPMWVLGRLLDLAHNSSSSEVAVRQSILESLKGTLVEPEVNRPDEAATYLTDQTNRYSVSPLLPPDSTVPYMTFGDWLQRRATAEQQPWEQLILHTVQTTSLMALHTGSVEYSKIMERISALIESSATARSSSQNFLQQPGVADIVRRLPANGPNNKEKDDQITRADTILQKNKPDIVARLQTWMWDVRAEVAKGQPTAGRSSCISH